MRAIIDFVERRGKRFLGPLVAALGVPVAAAVETALRFTSRRVGIGLLYHSVAVVQGDKTREIVAPHGVSTLERQLRHLRRYRIVDARDLLEATRRRRRGERFPVAITFDDDVASHASFALPALLQANAHATFFLSGASLDRPLSYWWERLQRAFDGRLADLPELVGVSTGATIHELALAIEYMSPEERAAVAARLEEQLGPDPDDAGMREQDVRRLVEADMTIGFHTRRHDALLWLPDDALDAALRDGREELERVVGHTLDVIAYPHGHADDRVAEAARAAGFVIGFAVADQAVWPDSDPLLQGRITPTYRSAGHFAIQLVLELLRRWR